MKFFNGIKVQIALFYMVASFFTVILIGFILYQSISNVVLDETLKSTKMSVEKSGTYIESYVDKVKDMTYVIANSPSTIDYLSDIEPDASDKEVIMTMINSTIESDPSIASIIIVGKSGRLISNEASLNMDMSDDMMKEAWYVSAIEAGAMPILTSARMQKFNMDKDHWVISLSRELRDTDGQNIGVLVIDLKYSVIEDYLKDLDLGFDGYAFILNNYNEVVYHYDTSYFESLDKKEELIKMASMEQGYDSSMNRLFHQYTLSNADWTLSGVASLDSLNAIRRQLLETIVIVGFVGLIFLLISGTYIAGRITNPIKKLEEAMKNIESGLYEIEVEAGGCNEAQSLALHYNQMVHKISTLLVDISEQEKSLKAYELNVLHSQINPHFLYNTLDTIVWMAEFGNSEKVVEVTTSLAKFFRLSLSGGSEVTNITQEVDHVRQYLFIQKERYKDKLNYEIELDESLSDVKIPKIILQPIVENAIYHGIRDLDGPGLIRITVAKDADDIVMSVSDNGVGFDTNAIQKQRDNNEIKLGGVGVANVDQRLKLAYGTDYGLVVESVIGEGTVVTLRIGSIMKKSL